MITGITHPDSGDIYLHDKRVNDTIPPQIGYMPRSGDYIKK
jgi:ABC-type multidrug transport system ATPase subunit